VTTEAGHHEVSGTDDFMTLRRRCSDATTQMRVPCFQVVLVVVLMATAIRAQSPTDSGQKSNIRPAEANTRPEPFDGASVDKMTTQCVTLETELGNIDIAFMPEVAPESVRSFLNLTATGALDTTTFSRTVKDFVIQGGNLSTSEKWNVDLAKRMTRKIPDEPGIVKHVRGIVSMARTDEPNSATTHFFILVGDGPHLDSKFAAFGTVTKGIEVADAINRAPADGEKPEKPVKINRAIVAPCKK
jgi:peptidyl-prolyl cis-trans isomerase B (cyclophilin B)